MEDSQYNGSLTYKAFNETIEKPLSVGDQLITFDGCGKMEITEIHSNTNTIVVRVMNGDFLNLIGVDQYDYSKGISDLSKIKFFSPPMKRCGAHLFYVQPCKVITICR